MRTEKARLACWRARAHQLAPTGMIPETVLVVLEKTMRRRSWLGTLGRCNQPADRVLCIGASHALGGTVAALETLAELVRPGG